METMMRCDDDCCIFWQVIAFASSTTKLVIGQWMKVVYNRFCSVYFKPLGKTSPNNYSIKLSEQWRKKNLTSNISTAWANPFLFLIYLFVRIFNHFGFLDEQSKWVSNPISRHLCEFVSKSTAGQSKINFVFKCFKICSGIPVNPLNNELILKY